MSGKLTEGQGVEITGVVIQADEKNPSFTIRVSDIDVPDFDHATGECLPA